MTGGGVGSGCSSRRHRHRHRLLLVLATLLCASAAGGAARAGHEITFYPSFYPQEITLKVLDAGSAGRALATGALQAYVGPDPFVNSVPPSQVRYVESLGGLVTVTFAPTTRGRCAAGARVREALAGAGGGFVAHGYPVTPFHPDWLFHWDLAQAEPAGAALSGAAPAWATPSPAGGAGELRDASLASARPLRVKAPARFTAALADAGLRVVNSGADAVIDVADMHTLLEATSSPWAKEGWFQAAQLYAAPGDRDHEPAATALARRERGQYATAAERVELERRIVSGLTRGCARMPLGYLVRREPYSAEYSNGIENIAWDSETGLDSAIFVRTVKLKEFMWNGWLALGVARRPAAAWNPVAGFTDPAGRLVWAALGDPAALASPYGAGWLANRVEPRQLETGPVAIAADALAPDPVTGALRRVGPGRSATAKIVYRVLMSKFHDGMKMSAADVLAPYAFAVRWAARDAGVERTTALLRSRVAAVRLLRVDSEIKDLGDLHLFYDVGLVEVYLRGEGVPADATTIAPPWSAVPWQLAALMDEAVTRGWAALSAAEARRRGVAWLDLARDARLRSRLALLAQDLERRALVPDALKAVVTPADARARWAALRRFAHASGHYLDTNGPYRLGTVSADAVVLSVFRDFSYPIGVGTFDRWALPLHAYVMGVESTPRGLAVTADVESVEKFERSYKILRGPFRPAPAGEGFKPVPPVVHYVALDADGHVKAAGASDRLDGGRLIVPLDSLERGAYRVVLAVTLGDNRVNPEIKVVEWTRS